MNGNLLDTIDIRQVQDIFSNGLFHLDLFPFCISLAKYKPQRIMYDNNTKATPEEEPNKSGVAK